MKNNTLLLPFPNIELFDPAKSFLRWPGSKLDVLHEIEKRLPPIKGVYHEPFLGGGSVFFRFGHQFDKRRSILADLNCELIEVYQSVKDNVEDLILLLHKHADAHEMDEGYYYYLRDQETPYMQNVMGRASRFVYLNKACWNGLYRVNKKGRFNVPKGNRSPFRNLTESTPKKLRAASTALQNVMFRVGPYYQTVKPQRMDFVYCDPPYTTIKDGFDRYQSDGFTFEHQRQLKRWLDRWTKQGVYVMISNADMPEINELYQGYTIDHITAMNRITWKNKFPRQEVLITNY